MSRPRTSITEIYSKPTEFLNLISNPTYHRVALNSESLVLSSLNLSSNVFQIKNILNFNFHFFLTIIFTFLTNHKHFKYHSTYHLNQRFNYSLKRNFLIKLNRTHKLRRGVVFYFLTVSRLRFKLHEISSVTETTFKRQLI